MPMVVLSCDPVNLSISNQGVPSCEDAGNNPAWVSIDSDNLQSIFQPISIADGLLITGAILFAWTIGYIGRLFIKTIIGSRWL